MATQQIQISTRAAFGPLAPGRDGIKQLLNWLQGVDAGVIDGTVIAGCDDTLMGTGTDSIMGSACGLITLSGGAGALTITAGGATVASATFAASDNNSAALLAANMNSTASTCFSTVRLARVTVGAGVTDGETVNVSGIVFTRLGASPSATARQFSNAAGLALAINLCPALANKYRAIDTGTSVYVCDLRASGDGPTVVLQGVGANITINAQSPVAGNVIMVLARKQGAEGNLLTLGVTGTGMTATRAIAYGNGNMTGFTAGVANYQVLL
jgi:hypothetical protein